MIVKLLAHTVNADKICASAGNSCYSERPSHELMDDGEDPERILSKIVGMGHHSVVEHATFTFSVQGVSRALTHQLVRHRVASFSQQSQRYVSLKEPTYVIPETIREDPEALSVYTRMMDSIWESYRKLCDRVPAEDARYILPNGTTTNITITMNARELLHFFSLRTCNRAQREIRDMADMMLMICRDVSPVVFRNAGPPCIRGPCPEGKLSCGKPRTELKKLK
ncbi:MAG: FAD-dependent thymidylate synthase [Methanomassiliicoccaceae archaeon]|nr:FAD-dependent thymidylate synthase [Methanomassiliicoccaceae archaeon]